MKKEEKYTHINYELIQWLYQHPTARLKDINREWNELCRELSEKQEK